MFKVQKYLICLLFGLFLIPLSSFAANDANGGYAPLFVGGKTIVVKYSKTQAGQSKGFKLTFVKDANFLEKMLFKLYGGDLEAATKKVEEAKGIGHGGYSYGKLGCNEANLTLNFANKQDVHPAGSTLVMHLKFNSETSGSFESYFTSDKDKKLLGTFMLK